MGRTPTWPRTTSRSSLPIIGIPTLNFQPSTSRSSLPIIGVPAVRAAEDLSRRNGCGFGLRQLLRPVHAPLWAAAGTGAVELGVARGLVRLGFFPIVPAFRADDLGHFRVQEDRARVNPPGPPQ